MEKSKKIWKNRKSKKNGIYEDNTEENDTEEDSENLDTIDNNNS